MATYAGVENWEALIYQFEETDVVQGGPLGIDNVPLKNLADRTTWLKAQIGRVNRLEDEVIFTGNAPIPGTLAGNLIVGYATALMNLTLEDAATFPHGAILPIMTFCNPGAVVNILTTGGQVFYNPVDGVTSSVNMHHLENIMVIALTDHFKVIYGNGNFTCAGEEIKARKARINTLALQGQILQRAQYPRLWKFVNEELTIMQEKVDEATWLSNPFTYRGLFSTGDGVSTFRIPDERGMFERMMDGGRGIDFYRTHPFPGGYEKDAIVDHVHNVNLNPNSNDQSGWGKVTTGNSANEGVIPTIKSSGPVDAGNNAIGAGETIVKNIGKLNLIKY